MGIRMNNPWIYIQLLKVVGFVNQSKKLTNNLRMPNADANLNDIGDWISISQTRYDRELLHHERTTIHSCKSIGRLNWALRLSYVNPKQHGSLNGFQYRRSSCRIRLDAVKIARSGPGTRVA